MNPSRRDVLQIAGLGLADLALHDLRMRDAGAPSGPHHRPRVRRVIQLGMIGAPSQIDLFEHKPELLRRDGEAPPAAALRGERFAFLPAEGRGATLLAPRWPVRRHGTNGSWLSDLLPCHRHIADRVTWLHAVHTDEINHVPAQLVWQTGSPRQGRPSFGAWIDYGLGRLADDLPAYVVLASGKAGRCGTACWDAGFLPARHQGVPLRSDGEPVLFLDDPPGLGRALRARSLDSLTRLDELAAERDRDPATRARIDSYELAFRMQASVPELVDLRNEPPATLELYGAEPERRSFAANCLLARRLVERGVRFVQLVHGGWDHHGGGGDQNLLTNLPQRCAEVDRAAAALIVDLDRRGLLDDTLVVWGGEFGRTPMLQGPRSDTALGRDHQRTAFTMWLCGGGLRAGLHHGETDDFGIRPIAGAVHVHDLHATLLHLLGIDHERLTYRFHGRDFRLTDVYGQVVEQILA
ncbi:MAG: DUF1501 domain-containing protein [Planctomycetes bacterium]|nr:DUF1501 domain-containing protein [Planctomycetota bacterium]